MPLKFTLSKKALLVSFGILLSLQSFSQKFEKFFPAKDLTSVGVYYYPEHWNPEQWDRDLKNIADLGFEFTHFAEFAWAQLEPRSEEHTSELQSRENLVCRLLLEKKNSSQRSVWSRCD